MMFTKFKKESPLRMFPMSPKFYETSGHEDTETSRTQTAMFSRPDVKPLSQGIHA